jgi:hypothetical protein
MFSQWVGLPRNVGLHQKNQMIGTGGNVFFYPFGNRVAIVIKPDFKIDKLGIAKQNLVGFFSFSFFKKQLIFSHENNVLISIVRPIFFKMLPGKFNGMRGVVMPGQLSTQGALSVDSGPASAILITSLSILSSPK